jgi:hypothetical protein
MKPELTAKVKKSMSEMAMEIGQYQYIPDYTETKKIVPETMSMRQLMEEMKRLHTKYCPGCDGGCPSEVYLLDATHILDELKLEGYHV